MYQDMNMSDGVKVREDRDKQWSEKKRQEGQHLILRGACQTASLSYTYMCASVCLSVWDCVFGRINTCTCGKHDRNGVSPPQGLKRVDPALYTNYTNK